MIDDVEIKVGKIKEIWNFGSINLFIVMRNKFKLSEKIGDQIFLCMLNIENWMCNTFY